MRFIFEVDKSKQERLMTGSICRRSFDQLGRLAMVLISRPHAQAFAAQGVSSGNSREHRVASGNACKLFAVIGQDQLRCFEVRPRGPESQSGLSAVATDRSNFGRHPLAPSFGNL
jgi:hypothetical protein